MSTKPMHASKRKPSKVYIKIKNKKFFFDRDKD